MPFSPLSIIINMNVLKVNNIRAGYGKKIILQDVSLELAPGEIRAVLGTSGCGKSTLMNNILGLQQPISGHMEILGKKLHFGRRKRKLPLDILRQIGVLFQNGALLSSLTVAENVALPLRIHNPELSLGVVQEQVRYHLNLVQMDHAFGLYPDELSGGMRKRVAIARAIVNSPKILFCDEPSAGLDPVTSRSLDELFIFLQQKLGIAMLLVTHELDSINTLCNTLTFLENGVVIYNGTLKDMKTTAPQTVLDFFARKTNTTQLSSVATSFKFEDQ
jgi:phospholipid/cholesterol/gamma-HCH transport system ATP-binding protein